MSIQSKTDQLLEEQRNKTEFLEKFFIKKDVFALEQGRLKTVQISEEQTKKNAENILVEQPVLAKICGQWGIQDIKESQKFLNHILSSTEMEQIQYVPNLEQQLCEILQSYLILNNCDRQIEQLSISDCPIYEGNSASNIIKYLGPSPTVVVQFQKTKIK